MDEDKIVFKDKTFVFTGEILIPRDDAKSKVILLGGRCTTLPSGKTDYLIVGTEPGVSKLKKAKELNIKIIYEEEFSESLERALRRSIRDVPVNVDGGIEVGDGVPDGGEEKGLNTASGSQTDTKTLGPCEQRQVPDLMWSEKYRPSTKDEIVGNKPVLASLEDFLTHKNQHKAALLSGPPGIGKTTAAHIVAKSLGFNIVEFNASDIRNKSSLVSEVGGVINTFSLSNNLKITKKVVIMDEVDGMSSDRGGLLELTKIIKTSTVPIICICNDRNNLKIRTLANHCLDLKFRQLDARQILPRLKEILKKENKHIEDSFLNKVISISNGDIRFILNTIQNLCMRKSINITMASNLMKKDIAKGTFEIAAEVFQRKKMADKIDLYFEDYAFIPLFVQENYLKMGFSNLSEMYKSSESISNGDIVEKMIRGANQEWSLAPLHAVFSVVMPTHNKSLHKRIDFPSWLGQNSKNQKLRRILQTFRIHSSRRLNSSLSSLRLYDSNTIYEAFITFLRKENVSEAVDLIVKLDLLQEDILNLGEVLVDGTKSYKEIKTKVKRELTKSYKSIKRNLPYTLEDKNSEEESAEE